jgi:hypothetical protein
MINNKLISGQESLVGMEFSAMLLGIRNFMVIFIFSPLIHNVVCY